MRGGAQGARRQVRLHHRRSGNGGMRVGEPSERGSTNPRPADRGRRERPLSLGPHPGRLPLLHREPTHRLEDEDRRRTRPERPVVGLSPRQAARGMHLDQRHDLHARPGRRLRPLARAGQCRVGVGRRPALLHEVRGLPRRRVGVPRRRRRVEGGAPAADLGCAPRRAEGRGRTRNHAARGLQHRRQRGYGLLRCQPAQRVALEHRQGLPAAGEQAPQPARPDECADRADPVRGQARLRRPLPPGQRAPSTHSRTRRSCSPPERSTRRASSSSRASGRLRSWPTTGSRSSTTTRRLARTCRITCRFVPCSRCMAPRRSTRSSTRPSARLASVSSTR